MSSNDFINSLNLDDERKQYAIYAYNQAANHPLAQKYENYPELKVKQFYQESRFDPNAVSPVGATGVAQFMPDTMPEVGLDANSARDPYSSIDASFAYDEILGKQLRNKGMEDSHLNVVAAYNAGAGNVSKHGGVPPFEETQKYVDIIFGSDSVGNYARGAVSREKDKSANNEVLETFDDMADPYGDSTILEPVSIQNPFDVDNVIQRSRDLVMNLDTAIASTDDYDDLVSSGLVMQNEDGQYDIPSSGYQAYNRALPNFGYNGAAQIAQQYDGGSDGALSYGVDVFQKTIGEGVAAIGDWTGFEGLSEYGNKIVQQQIDDINEGRFVRQYDGSFLEQEGLDKLGWLWENTLIQAPNIAANVAATIIPFGLGARLGGFGVSALNKGLQATGKTAITEATKGKVKNILGGLSASLAGSVQGTGSMVEELKEKGVYDEDALNVAIGFGVVSGALNSALPAFAFGKLGSVTGTSLLNNTLGIMSNIPETVLSGIGKEVLTTTAKGIAIEGSTEVIEEALQMSIAHFEGAEYADGEVGARLFDSFILGGSMGGGLSSSTALPKYAYIKHKERQAAKSIDEMSKVETSRPSVTTEDIIVEGGEFNSVINEQDIEVRKEVGSRANDRKPSIESDYQKIYNGTVKTQGSERKQFSNTGLTQDGVDYASAKGEDIVQFTKLVGDMVRGSSNSDKVKIQKSYNESDGGSKKYSEIKKTKFNTAKKEIREIFNTIQDIDIGKSDNLYATQGDKEMDFYGNGGIVVRKDNYTNSLLFEKIQDTDLTLGEALDAIYNIYGDVLGSKDNSIKGTLNSIQRTTSMFSKEAQPAIFSELVARKFPNLSTDDNIDNMSKLGALGQQYDKAGNDIATKEELSRLMDDVASKIHYFDESTYKSDLLPASVVNEVVGLVSNTDRADSDATTIALSKLSDAISPYTNINPKSLEKKRTFKFDEQNSLVHKHIGTQNNIGVMESTSTDSIDSIIKNARKEQNRTIADAQESISKTNIEADIKENEALRQAQDADINILEGAIFEKFANSIQKRVGRMNPALQKVFNYVTTNVINIKEANLEQVNILTQGDIEVQGKKAVEIKFLFNKYVKDSIKKEKATAEYNKLSKEEKDLKIKSIRENSNDFLIKIMKGEYMPAMIDPTKGYSIQNIREDGEGGFYYIDTTNGIQVSVDRIIAQIGSEASRLRAGMQDKLIENSIHDANVIQERMIELDNELARMTNGMISSYENGVEGWIAQNPEFSKLKAFSTRGDGMTLSSRFDEIVDSAQKLEGDIRSIESLRKSIDEHYKSEGDGSYISRILIDNIDRIANDTVNYEPNDSGQVRESKLDERKNELANGIIDALRKAENIDGTLGKYESYKADIEALTGEPIGVDHDLFVGAYSSEARKQISRGVVAYNDESMKLRSELGLIDNIMTSNNGFGAYIHRMYRAHSDEGFAKKMARSTKVIDDKTFAELESKYKDTNDFVKEDAYVYRYNKALKDKTDYVYANPKEILLDLKQIQDGLKDDVSGIEVDIDKVISDHEQAVTNARKNETTYKSEIEKTDSVGYINNKAFTLAKGKVDDMIARSTDKFDEGYGGVGYSDSVVRKRNDISESDRQLLGEYTDIEDIVKNTLVSMSTYNAQKRMYNFLYDNYINVSGDEKYVFREGEMRDAQNSTDKTISDRASNLVPLDFKFLEKFGYKQGDLYTTPEIKNALSSFDNLVSDNFFIKAMQGINTEFKYWTTIANPEQYAANLMSNIPSLIMNGNYTNWLKGDPLTPEGNSAKWVMDMARLVRGGKGSIENAELADALSRIGANSDDVRLFTSLKNNMPLRALAENVADLSSNTKAGYMANKGNQAIDATTKFMEDFYALGDIAPKLSAYMYNLELMRGKFGETFTDNQIKDFATQITTLTMPNFSQLPKVLKDIQTKTPVGGSFVSFQFFAFSTIANQFKVIRRLQEIGAIDYMVKKDPSFDVEAEIKRQKDGRGFFSVARPTPSMKEYMSSGEYLTSPASIKTAGLVGGVGLYSGGLTAVVSAIATSIGGEEVEEFNKDEMKQSIRNMLPEYYRNLDFVVTDINEDGSMKIMNLSRLNNFAPIKDIYTVFNNESLSDVDKAKEIMGIMSFGLEQENFGYKFLKEAYDGEDEWGKRIYEEDDNILEKTAKITGRYFSTIATNSFLRKTNDLRASLFSDEIKYDKSGYPINAQDVVLGLNGFRMINVDPIRDSGYKIREINTSLTNSRTDLSSKLTSNLSRYNKISDAEITSALTRTRDWHYEKYNELLKTINTMRDFGLTDEQIQETLVGSRISKANTKILINGGIPTFDVSKLGSSKVDSASRLSISKEAKANMEYNFDRMRMLNNNLPMHESQKSSSLFDIYFPQR